MSPKNILYAAALCFFYATLAAAKSGSPVVAVLAGVACAAVAWRAHKASGSRLVLVFGSKPRK